MALKKIYDPFEKKEVWLNKATSICKGCGKRTMKHEYCHECRRKGNDSANSDIQAGSHLPEHEADGR